LQHILQGEQELYRVQLVKLGIDQEVLETINDRYLDKPCIRLTEGTLELHFRQIANLYYRLGCDSLRVPYWHQRWVHYPLPRWRGT
jgi:hypothetical protein